MVKNERDGILVDIWTIPHFFVPFGAALWLIPLGVQALHLLVLAAVWEVLEHTTMGRKYFGWSNKSKEDVPNALMDIIVASFGIMAAQAVLAAGYVA